MKIIFIYNYGIGDSVWAEPILRHFLSQQEEVIFMTRHSCIYDEYPDQQLHINKQLPFPLPEQPIALNYLEQPCMHILDCYRRQAGIPELELSLPRLYLTDKEKERKIQRPYAILHLDFYRERRTFRNVYGVDWDKVVSFVQDQGLEVVQLSKEGELLFAPWMQTKDVREVMSLIYNANLFIGLDSGPSHIAAAMQIPSVIFFGSVNPAYRHLDNHKKVFLQSPCPFAHCYHREPMSAHLPCLLVPYEQPPPCCIHDTSRVIEAIRSIVY